MEIKKYNNPKNNNPIIKFSFSKTICVEKIISKINISLFAESIHPSDYTVVLLSNNNVDSSLTTELIFEIQIINTISVCKIIIKTDNKNMFDMANTELDN